MSSDPTAKISHGAGPLRLTEEPLVRLDDEGKWEFATRNRSAAALFSADTGMPPEEHDGIYQRALRSPQEIAAAIGWQARRLQHVFMSDALDSSIALDDLFRGHHGSFTSLGRLEGLAKASEDGLACEALAASLADYIRSSPLYSNCLICAVPGSPEKRFDLPSALASRVARALGTRDVTSLVRFLGEKQPIKTLALEGKRAALDAAGLQVKALPSRPVILIDDKYQSGTTANWIGVALRSAGATSVHGVYVVKTWRGRDNVAPPGDRPD